MQEEEIGLSANALEALKAFAQDQGIQIQQDQDVVDSVQKAFNIDTSKQYTEFKFDFKDNSNNINIVLKGVEQDQGQTLQSTGLTIWRAAEDLSNYIFQNRQQFAGKQIIELGAGLGLVGVLLGCINKDGFVNITDGDEENGKTIELLEENIKKNNHLLKQKSLNVQRLWWGDQKEIDIAVSKSKNQEGYDLIFGADIIYNEQSIQPLIQTVTKVLKKDKDAKFYLAFARRNVPIDFVFKEAQKQNLVFEEVQDFKCKLNEEQIYIFKWKL